MYLFKVKLSPRTISSVSAATASRTFRRETVFNFLFLIYFKIGVRVI